MIKGFLFDLDGVIVDTAVFEFSELPNPFDIPQNLDLVIDVNGAQVWASKLD